MQLELNVYPIHREYLGKCLSIQFQPRKTLNYKKYYKNHHKEKSSNFHTKNKLAIVNLLRYKRICFP